MLYEMLAGRLPFEGDCASSVAHAHAFEKPRPLGGLAPSISPRMLAVVEQAMAKDPSERFEDASEMLDALAPMARTSGRNGAASPATVNVTCPMDAIHQTSRAEPVGGLIPPGPGDVGRSDGLAAGYCRWVWLPLLLLRWLGYAGAFRLPRVRSASSRNSSTP